jgi:CheY-like chemotaxis protein
MNSNRPSDPGHGDAAPPHQAPPARILVVDDEEYLRTMVHDYLAGQYPRATVEMAADGASAITAAERLEPDLVITDFNLPDMTGLEVARRIRAARAGRILKILVVTGNSDPAVLANILAGGVDACLAKPFKLRDLIRQVTTLVPPEQLA